MAFATYEDVAARWRELTADEQSRATVLLDDAAVILRSRVAVVDGDEDQAAALKTVSCNMVIRAMVAASSAAFGVSELNATMGPFAQTARFANPNGDLYLTKQDRRIIGITGGRGRILHPSYGVDDD